MPIQFTIENLHKILLEIALYFLNKIIQNEY